MADSVSSYVLQGGREAFDRLRVLAGVAAPATGRVFDSLGDMTGWTVIDAGCGSGDVAFALARRVGPTGRVFGLDLNQNQLSIVSAEAIERGLSNVSLQVADVQKPWPVDYADMAFARFVLTHLPDPLLALTHAFRALRPEGILVVEDIDWAGHFCDPPSAAFESHVNYYLRAAKLRGGDPSIGIKLDLLFERAGFAKIETTLVQYFGRTGDIKLLPELTMAVMADGLLSAGLASRSDVDVTISDLRTFVRRSDTLVSGPRIFQVRGRRPLG